jgi:hypothetical protein
MNDLELTLSWADDGTPSGLRFTARGWALHTESPGQPPQVEAFADLGALAHAIVERQAAGKEGASFFSAVSGPGVPRPLPWPSIAAVVAEVGARTPPPLPGSGTMGAAAEHTLEVIKDAPIWVKQSELQAVLTAMVTRPFVLLAGISGSGKTQLARRLGKAWAAGWIEHGQTLEDTLKNLRKNQFLGAWVEDDWCAVHDLAPGPSWQHRYAFTAVQSDWTDASHLWGYHVPLPESAAGFYGTAALRVFLSAWDQEFRSASMAENHFLLLDEMNLSRPEHYGSDLLSAMEVKAPGAATAEKATASAPGEAVIELHRAGAALPLRGDGVSAGRVPPRIGWGRNLLVMGTVNVDETTFSFAPKVLDRAALLEFTDIDLKIVFQKGRALPASLQKVWAVTEVQEWFEGVQGYTKDHNLHLGYRAAREVLASLAVRGVSNDTLDLQLRNKVLPRVRGPRAAVTPVLLKLLFFAAGSPDEEILSGAAGLQHADLAAIENGMKHAIEKNMKGQPKYPQSCSKILEMLRRAHAVGFTSYFG